jgi:CheY-like chemotaxis protein
MGLGLAIVERACARLSHRLDLVSGVGRGSVFRVGLELAEFDDAEPPQSALPRGQAGPVAATTTIVMLVDDDSGLRAALETLLESWGVAVIEAPGTAEALSLLDEVGIVPDAFLLDQQLQNGETGLALARILRERYGAVRLRIMSADRRAELREACDAEGIELLPKPLDPERLRAFVAEAATATAAAGGTGD